MDKLRSGNNKTLSSKLKWQKDYDKENMKVTGIKHSTEERSLWEMSAEKNGLKLSSFVRLCVMYCINNNVDIKNYGVKADLPEKPDGNVKKL